MSGRWAPRRVFVAIVGAYGLGLLAWLSIYLLEHFQVAGLTDRSRCDWMWCTPTVLGIVVVAIVWLGVAWLLSLAIARLRSRA